MPSTTQLVQTSMKLSSTAELRTFHISAQTSQDTRHIHSGQYVRLSMTTSQMLSTAGLAIAHLRSNITRLKTNTFRPIYMPKHDNKPKAQHSTNRSMRMRGVGGEMSHLGQAVEGGRWHRVEIGRRTRNLRAHPHRKVHSAAHICDVSTAGTSYAEV